MTSGPRVITPPVTPVFPSLVSPGDIIRSASYGNTVTQCLKDLWTDIQAIATQAQTPLTSDVDAANHKIFNVSTLLIGTATGDGTTKLQVTGPASFNGPVISRPGSTADCLANTELGSLRFQGYVGGVATARKAGVFGYAAENWTAAANGSYLIVETAAIGSNVVREVARFNSTGNLLIASAAEIAGGSKLQVTGSLTLSNPVSSAMMQFYVSSAGANEKFWRVRSDPSALTFDCANDALSAANAWLQVTRSGNTPQYVIVTAPIQLQIRQSASGGYVFANMDDVKQVGVIGSYGPSTWNRMHLPGADGEAIRVMNPAQDGYVFLGYLGTSSMGRIGAYNAGWRPLVLQDGAWGAPVSVGSAVTPYAGRSFCVTAPNATIGNIASANGAFSVGLGPTAADDALLIGYDSSTHTTPFGWVQCEKSGTLLRPLALNPNGGGVVLSCSSIGTISSFPSNTLTFYQPSATQLSIIVKCSDGNQRMVTLTLA